MEKYKANETMKRLGRADVLHLADPKTTEKPLKDIIEANGLEVTGQLFDFALNCYTWGRLAEQDAQKDGAQDADIKTPLYKAQSILLNASKLLNIGEDANTLSSIDAALDYLKQIEGLIEPHGHAQN